MIIDGNRNMYNYYLMISDLVLSRSGLWNPFGVRGGPKLGDTSKLLQLRFWTTIGVIHSVLGQRLTPRESSLRQLSGTTFPRQISGWLPGPAPSETTPRSNSPKQLPKLLGATLRKWSLCERVPRVRSLIWIFLNLERWRGMYDFL